MRKNPFQNQNRNRISPGKTSSVAGIALVCALTLVACGKLDGGSVPVNVVPPSPEAVAMSACRNDVQRLGAVKVGGEQGEGEPVQTVAICESSGGSSIGTQSTIDPMAQVKPAFEGESSGDPLSAIEPSSPTTGAGTSVIGGEAAEKLNPATAYVASESAAKATKGYAIVKRPLSYSVKLSQRTGRLLAQLRVGVVLPTELNKDVQVRSLGVLNKICAPKIEKIFADSASSLDLELTFDRPTSEDELQTGSKFDQFLELIPAPAELIPSGEGYPALVMARWPTRGLHLPQGMKVDMDACSRINDSRGQSACKMKAYEKSNEEFCAATAIMVGYWLGLQSDSENITCTAEATALSTATDQKALENSAFTKASIDRQAGKPGEFFKTAKASHKDATKILGPVCPSLKATAAVQKILNDEEADVGL